MRRGLGGLLAGAAIGYLLRGGRRGYNPMGGGMGMGMPYRRRRGGSLLPMLIMGAIAYFGYQHYQKQQPTLPLPKSAISGRAQQVIDGDTFHLGGFAIRLWGIDAPERDTAAGPKSTQALQTILRGRNLTCQPMDWSHQRLVARCDIGGRDLSMVMVRTGWAKDLPSKSRGAYAELEAQARADGRGIWAN
jgi:endonuclease YncB( thermonuclease family)